MAGDFIFLCLSPLDGWPLSTQVTLDTSTFMQLVSRDGNLNCLHTDMIPPSSIGYLLSFYFEIISDIQAAAKTERGSHVPFIQISCNYSTYLPVSMPCRQRPTRNTPLVQQVRFITHCSKGDHTPWGTAGHLSRSVVERTYYRIGALVG